MEYIHEQFEYGHELVNFLNKHKIKRENIISIYGDRYFNHLIYIVNE